MLAVGIGCGVSATRGIFAMAGDGRLPAPLAVVSRRRSSPLGATVLVTGFCAAALLADVFWKGLFALPETPHYDALFSWGSTFGGFALVAVYLLMAIGSLRSFAHSPRQLWLALSAALRHLDHRRRHLRIVLPGDDSHRPRAVVRTRRPGHRFRLHLGHTRPQISRQPLPGLTEIAQIPPTQPRSASLAGGLGAPVKAPGCRSRDHPRPALHRFSVTPRSTGARTTSVRSNDLDFGSNGIPAMGWRGSREAGWPARPSRRPSP